MRLIYAADISEAVANLFKQANYGLGEDVLAALKKARQDEESPIGREVIDTILENARVAATEKIPLCQDCGVAVVFLEIGQRRLARLEHHEHIIDRGGKGKGIGRAENRGNIEDHEPVRVSRLHLRH
jgi:tartrate dehydratase alpha subunit/fumarate hydratase class I-like protein